MGGRAETAPSARATPATTSRAATRSPQGPRGLGGRVLACSADGGCARRRSGGARARRADTGREGADAGGRAPDCGSGAAALRRSWPDCGLGGPGACLPSRPSSVPRPAPRLCRPAWRLGGPLGPRHRHQGSMGPGRPAPPWPPARPCGAHVPGLSRLTRPSRDVLARPGAQIWWPDEVQIHPLTCEEHRNTALLFFIF